MFEVDMKEALENRMEIPDFEPVVVQTMIEFCENDKVEDLHKLTEDVFKIAHKYQIEDLMV